MLIQSRDGVVVQQALTRAIEVVMARRSRIIYQRGLRRAQERRAADTKAKQEIHREDTTADANAGKSQEQVQQPLSAARELVTLILEEYDKYKSTPLNHNYTPLSVSGE